MVKRGAIRGCDRRGAGHHRPAIDRSMILIETAPPLRKTAPLTSRAPSHVHWAKRAGLQVDAEPIESQLEDAAVVGGQARDSNPDGAPHTPSNGLRGWPIRIGWPTR